MTPTPATTAGPRRVPVGELSPMVSGIFRSVGMSDEDADLMATTLIASDLRGVPSHGVIHVPGYVGRLTTGGVDPRGRPTVERRKGGALRIDGGNSMGQIGSAFAMERAIEQAREVGVAMATVGNSNHSGAMAFYAMMALEHDMIGIALSNAVPTMAPWGGRDRILGINPIGIAIPTDAAAPFVLDVSFSAVSRSKIVVHHQGGMSLEDGWALDAEGRPTQDAAAALEGLLLPIGGYKGTGLAIASGVLCTLLSGAGFGTDLGSLEAGAVAGADGHALLAVDIGAFEDPAAFRARMTAVLDRIRNSNPAPGVDRITYPGEGGHERARANRAAGVPLSEDTWSALKALCD